MVTNLRKRFKRIRGLSISDLHWGNSRNPATDMISALEHYMDNFSPTSPMTSLDIIAIVGDLFDKELNFGDDSIYEVILFFRKLFDFAATHNIAIRLLRGTFSHDKNQCRQIEALAKALNYLDGRLDFKYYETLEIEYHERLDVHMLFIPDNHAPTTDITYDAVVNKMKQLGLEKVDLTFMHGTFQYQLRYGKEEHKHNERQYLDITRHWIFVGHIHVHSFFERIVAQGSFDRTTHGEEGDKGGVLWEINDIEGNSFRFKPNTRAKKFVTVKLESDDADKSIKQLERVLERLPNGSAVRIMAVKTHPLMQGIDELRVLYPFYVFSKESIDAETDDEASLRLIESVRDDGYVPIIIDETNIVDMILGGLSTRKGLLPSARERLKGLLTEYL